MTPVEASKSKNELTVYKNLYPEKEEKIKKPKFEAGNTVVFTDYRNNQLIIRNVEDGSDIHRILLSYKPLYMTVVNSNTVAVSCKFNKTILIINISTRSVTSTINTSRYCGRIAYKDKHLYVVIDKSIIRVMDLTGKVIRTIPLHSGVRITDITVDRDRLVSIDWTTLYCCSLDGQLIWMFKMDQFKDLSRLTTDNEGTVYVTNYETNTVVFVSNDGKIHKEYRTQSDKLDVPSGIYFDKKENSLLVGNHTD
ncbi:Hypothetical predicted protein, partial [Mytilus galloprovincialis]